MGHEYKIKAVNKHLDEKNNFCCMLARLKHAYSEVDMNERYLKELDKMTDVRLGPRISLLDILRDGFHELVTTTSTLLY